VLVLHGVGRPGGGLLLEEVAQGQAKPAHQPDIHEVTPRRADVTGIIAPAIGH
jgi:hypothetical protein